MNLRKFSLVLVLALFVVNVVCQEDSGQQVQSSVPSIARDVPKAFVPKSALKPITLAVSQPSAEEQPVAEMRFANAAAKGYESDNQKANKKSVDRLMWVTLGSIICFAWMMVTWLLSPFFPHDVMKPHKMSFPARLHFYIFTNWLCCQAVVLMNFSLDMWNNSTWCTAQAALITFFFHCAMAWTTILAINMSIMLKVDDPSSINIVKYEAIYHAIVWTVGLASMIAVLTQKDHVGPMSMFCWVERPLYLRVVVMHAPLLIEVILSLCASVAIGQWLFELVQARQRPNLEDQQRKKRRNPNPVVRIFLFLVVFIIVMFICVTRRMVESFTNTQHDDYTVSMTEIAFSITGYVYLIFFGILQEHFVVWKRALTCSVPTTGFQVPILAESKTEA